MSAVRKNTTRDRLVYAELFKKRFCLATKRARINAGIRQARMAQKLGIKHKTYCNYERRAMLPVWLQLKFCEIARVTVADLYHG